MTDVREKQVLIIFVGGLEVEIKNLVKVFQPKQLKQAYKQARSHINTLFYKRNHLNPTK